VSRDVDLELAAVRRVAVRSAVAAVVVQTTVEVVGARFSGQLVEATVSKVADEQLFYLMSRGLSEEQAMGMVVNGFIEPITRTLPMEYAVAWSRLIELQMEGSVG